MSKRKSQQSNKQLAKREIAAGRREVAVAAHYHHSGPIPDPMTLERYENLLPGAADRILRMAEEQSAHRRLMEDRVIRSRSRDSFLGIISGLLIALATLGSGTFVIIQGFTWSGTVLGSAGLVGLVSVFIYGTNSARKEREAKGD